MKHTAAIVMWLAVIGVGLYAMESYSFTPNARADAPTTWPDTEQLPTASGKATLVMFAHPRCPCTRASVGELARIMARCKNLVTAYVVFLKYEGTGDQWEQTDLWDKTAAIPSVQVVTDNAGRIARQFAARTSGETLLYDAGGSLMFHGGITSSRGHHGDNAGHSAIISLLTTGVSEQTENNVFGCVLWNERSESDGESP